MCVCVCVSKSETASFREQEGGEALSVSCCAAEASDERGRHAALTLQRAHTHTDTRKHRATDGRGGQRAGGGEEEARKEDQDKGARGGGRGRRRDDGWSRATRGKEKVKEVVITQRFAPLLTRRPTLPKRCHIPIALGQTLPLQTRAPPLGRF